MGSSQARASVLTAWFFVFFVTIGFGICLRDQEFAPRTWAMSDPQEIVNYLLNVLGVQQLWPSLDRAEQASVAQPALVLTPWIFVYAARPGADAVPISVEESALLGRIAGALKLKSEDWQSLSEAQVLQLLVQPPENLPQDLEYSRFVLFGEGLKTKLSEPLTQRHCPWVQVSSPEEILLHPSAKRETWDRLRDFQNLH